MRKSSKWIALFTILVMSIAMLSACAGGRTYEEVGGNQGAVNVPDREGEVLVPYTGDPIVEIIEIEGEVIEVEEGQEPGADENGNNGGGENENNGGSGENENNGGSDTDSDEDEDIEIEEGEYDWIPKFTAKDVIKILDQNVRCISDEKDGYAGTSLAERHLRIKEQVEKYDPDVMGFQEVRPEWMDYLKADYGSEYDYYNWFRAANNAAGVDGDECSAVFWKKDKFEKLATGHFWLGDNPDSPSKYPGQTDQHRICNWAKLKNKENGKTFVFASVHYSTDSITISPARVMSAQTMTTQLRKAAGSAPVICVGDYNMARNSEEYNALMQAGLLSDLNDDLSYYNSDRGYDNHSTAGGYKTSPTAFDENGETFGSIIDFVMISNTESGLYPKEYKVLQEKFGAKYDLANQFVSDHFGIYAEVVIPSKK